MSALLAEQTVTAAHDARFLADDVAEPAATALAREIGVAGPAAFLAHALGARAAELLAR